MKPRNPNFKAHMAWASKQNPMLKNESPIQKESPDIIINQIAFDVFKYQCAQLNIIKHLFTNIFS